MTNSRKSQRAVEAQERSPATALKVNDPAPTELDQLVDESLAMQMISIRLPKRLLDDLKLIAKKEGLGYQPLMRRVLTRFASAELRAMARIELGEPQAVVAEHEEEAPPRYAAMC